MKAVVVILATGFWLSGCGGESHTAVLTLVEGAEHLPCAGMRRLRVTAFRNEVEGVGIDLFGVFYNPDGTCNLPAGLPAELPGLPLTGKMWVLVEGFDSTEKRRLSMAQTGVIGNDMVSSGSLGELVLEREPVSGTYASSSLVIAGLPGLAEAEPLDELSFNLNYGTADSINGAFRRNPAAGWSSGPLVISNLLPRLDNRILVVGRRGGAPVATWQAEAFDIDEGELFVEIQPQKSD